MFERFKTGAKRPIQAYLDKVYNHGKGLILTQGTNGYNHSTKKGSKSFFIVYKQMDKARSKKSQARERKCQDKVREKNKGLSWEK